MPPDIAAKHCMPTLAYIVSALGMQALQWGIEQGLFREVNPGPLSPYARIMQLNQTATKEIEHNLVMILCAVVILAHEREACH